MELTKTTINVRKPDNSTVIAYVSPHEKCWRLVHDGKNVLELFEGEGNTRCIHKMFCATEQECLDEIARLKLEYTPENITSEAK
jgi:hypothetical protein